MQKNVLCLPRAPVGLRQLPGVPVYETPQVVTCGLTALSTRSFHDSWQHELTKNHDRQAQRYNG